MHVLGWWGEKAHAVSDEELEQPSLRLFGIGDWGNTNTETLAAKDAQKNLAELMGKYAAAELQQSLSAVITHGDNFYWGGLAHPNHEKFREAFELVYSAPSLATVPFLVTMGNHDIGGNAFLCGRDPGTSTDHDRWHVPCQSRQEAMDAVLMYHTATQTYSARKTGSGRLTYDGPYYKRYYESPQSRVSVEVFNVDTNLANTGSICCQKEGYRECADRLSGIPKETFMGCRDVLKKHFFEGMEQLASDLRNSNATWKVVNSHYCPSRHIGGIELETLLQTVLGQAHVWMCGHTHSTAHDYSKRARVHILMNGAGGGIRLDAHAGRLPPDGDITTLWAPERSVYAFTDLQMTSNYMKAYFVTYDVATTGGQERIYCKKIPLLPGPAIDC